MAGYDKGYKVEQWSVFNELPSAFRERLLKELLTIANALDEKEATTLIRGHRKG